MIEQDMELTRLASKAAGIKLEQGTTRLADTTQTWRPLDDDGDALRLAVKLKMCIDTDWNQGANAANAQVSFDDPEYGYQEGNGRNDRNAATRRAIVRAASEIGKAMLEAEGVTRETLYGPSTTKEWLNEKN